MAINFSQTPNENAIGDLPASILATDTETGVADNTQTTVVTYTATASNKTISRISCSGTDYAKFEVFKNLSLIDTKRLGPDRNVEFGSFDLDTGDIIDVKVTHFQIGLTANFEATIYGV